MVKFLQLTNTSISRVILSITLLIVYNFPIKLLAEFTVNDNINFYGNNHIDTYQSIDENANQAVDLRLDNRFMTAYTTNHFKSEFHLLTSVSNYVQNNFTIPVNLPIEGDKTNLFRLTRTDNFNNSSMVNRIDRINFTYYDNNLEATIGRTALTWSRGRTFHVTDFFNPQNPGFYDGDYKIGTDMAYVNWAVSDNSYFSVVANPKRNSCLLNPKHSNSCDGDVTMKDSTFASRYIYSNAWGDVSIIIGQYLEDYALGGGFSYGLWGGTVLRTDVSFWSPEYDRQDYQSMAMVGLEKGLSIFSRNITLFGEYYHNDFGTKSPKNENLTLNPTMQRRVLEMDTYLIGKNYISLGALVEISSYWDFNYSNIINTDDGSMFNFISLSYEATDAISLSVTIGQSLGDTGDDFGDICIAGTGNTGENTCYQMETIFMLGLSITL